MNRDQERYGLSREIDQRLLATNPLTTAGDIAEMITSRQFARLGYGAQSPDPPTVRRMLIEAAHEVVADIETAWKEALIQSAMMRQRVKRQVRPDGKVPQPTDGADGKVTDEGEGEGGG